MIDSYNSQMSGIRVFNVNFSFDHSNAHAQLLSGPRSLAFCPRLLLTMNIVWVNSDGSDETVHLCRLT